MKKVVYLIAVCLLLSLLAGCGGKSPQDCRVFLLEENEGFRESEAVYFNAESKVLTKIVRTYELSKDRFDAEYVKGMSKLDWDAFIPGYITYDFAECEFTEDDTTLTVTITLSNLDSRKNVRALIDGGFLTQEQDVFVDAEAYMKTLLDNGAEERDRRGATLAD